MKTPDYRISRAGAQVPAGPRTAEAGPQRSAESGRRKALCWALLAAIAVLHANAFAADPGPPQSATILADKSAQALSQFDQLCRRPGGR